MPNVYFKSGTRAKFDALETKDVNTLYWLTDTEELFKGETLFGKGKEATAAASGLMSAEDKVRLDKLIASGVADLMPVDTSILIAKNEDGKLTVKAAISEDEDNALSLHEDGLFVPVPEVAVLPAYAIERQGEAEDGYSATYRLKKTLGENSEYVGDPINIPKDMVVESGSVQTVTTDDEPYTGAKVGDKYIDLVIANATSDHLYIPVNDLVDTYTAGDGISISNGVISTTNRTVEVLNGANGTARIWNESDGGGVQFTHNDGTRSFTGVNDGGKDGITGQLYSVDTKNGNLGTRLNMTSNGFFYFKGKTSATAYTADDEIATKGDINDAVEAAALVWQDI